MKATPSPVPLVAPDERALVHVSPVNGPPRFWSLSGAVGLNGSFFEDDEILAHHDVYTDSCYIGYAGYLSPHWRSATHEETARAFASHVLSQDAP